MRTALFSVAAVLLAGCSSPMSAPEPVRSTALESSDLKLAERFFHALYRPRHSSDRIVVDASAEDSFGHIPLVTRNRELAARLDTMRQPPRPLRLVVHSGDRPEPYGSSHFVYTYDAATGKFTALGPHSFGVDTPDSSNMWLDIRHWPDGTRLVCVSHWWINDLRDDIFHLRQGESKFRFAVASIPIID